MISDRGLAAGVRRIEAITSLGAVERLTRDEQILGELSEAAQVPPEDLPASCASSSPDSGTGRRRSRS